MTTVFLHTDEQFPAIQLEISFSFNGIDEAKSYNRIYHEIWVSPLEFILVLYTKEGEENFSEILTLSREQKKKIAFWVPRRAEWDVFVCVCHLREVN
jgi:hypothetical protein